MTAHSCGLRRAAAAMRAVLVLLVLARVSPLGADGGTIEAPDASATASASASASAYASTPPTPAPPPALAVDAEVVASGVADVAPTATPTHAQTTEAAVEVELETDAAAHAPGNLEPKALPLHRTNFASEAAGATIMASNPEMTGASSLLGADDDAYALSKCDVPKKFVVIGLTEDVMIDTVVLSNDEKYSSAIKEFRVVGSRTYPTSEWVVLGTFEAQNRLGEQSFTIGVRAWVRFVKLSWLSHYGAEFYCTWTNIRVHGATMLEDLQQLMLATGAEVQLAQLAISQQQQAQQPPPVPPTPPAASSEAPQAQQSVSVTATSAAASVAPVTAISAVAEPSNVAEVGGMGEAAPADMAGQAALEAECVSRISLTAELAVFPEPAPQPAAALPGETSLDAAASAIPAVTATATAEAPANLTVAAAVTVTPIKAHASLELPLPPLPPHSPAPALLDEAPLPPQPSPTLQSQPTLSSSSTEQGDAGHSLSEEGRLAEEPQSLPPPNASLVLPTMEQAEPLQALGLLSADLDAAEALVERGLGVQEASVAADVLAAVAALSSPLLPLARGVGAAGASVAGGAAVAAAAAGGHHPASTNVFQVLTSRLKDLEIDRSVMHALMEDAHGKYAAALAALVRQVEAVQKGVNGVRNQSFGVRHSATVDALVDALAAAREAQAALEARVAREAALAARTTAALEERLDEAARSARLAAATSGAALVSLLAVVAWGAAKSTAARA